MQHPARTLIATALLALCAPFAQAASVAEVFRGDMLDTNQRYFESIAGIPRESSGDQHLFRVSGCNITATIQNNSVTALRMELTPSCQVDLSSFLGESFSPPAAQRLSGSAAQQLSSSPSAASSRPPAT